MLQKANERQRIHGGEGNYNKTVPSNGHCHLNIDDGEPVECQMSEEFSDGGWGWGAVCASFIVCFISDGIGNTFGFLYIELLKEFKESESKTAWIGSLYNSVPYLMGPIASVLVERFGCRWMTFVGGIIAAIGFLLSACLDSIDLFYFTYGVLPGFGIGLCIVSGVVSINYWFKNKIALATGIGACGSGIGTFVYSPLGQYLFAEYGWKMTLVFLSGTFLPMSLSSFLIRHPEECSMKHEISLSGRKKIQYKSPALARCHAKCKKCSAAARNVQYTAVLQHEADVPLPPCVSPDNEWYVHILYMVLDNIDMFNESHFLALSLSTILASAASSIPYFCLGGYIISNNGSTNELKVLLNVMGIASTIGTIFLGSAGDRPRVNMVKLHCVCLMISGLSTIVMVKSNFLGLVVSCAAFGFFSVSLYSSLSPITQNLIPKERFSRAYGILLMCQGIGILTGVPLAAWYHDISETWCTTFYASGTISIVSGLIMGITLCTKYRTTRGSSVKEKYREINNQCLVFTA